jgi:hypothetical protein
MMPREILERGCSILDPVMVPAGFRFAFRDEGTGSGGNYAWGEYVRDDRRLELHFRYSLGLVTYHAAGEIVAHEHLMAAIVGRLHATRYPGFSADPLAGFEDLKADLSEHGKVFLAEKNDDAFRLAAHRAKTFAAKKGLAALP